MAAIRSVYIAHFVRIVRRRKMSWRDKTNEEQVALLQKYIVKAEENFALEFKGERTPWMFLGAGEKRKIRAIRERYSSLVLGRLEDEVTLDPRYRNGEWMTTKTLLDLIRKGLAAG
jgi:hypothetical protein